MQLHVGTSGYSYKQWKGSFYPPDLAANRMLAFYGARFGSVEINNTFYRMPRTEVLAAWSEQVPDGFVFAIKASRRITHIKRLRDVADPLAFLHRQLATLGDKLGPVLYQLPPTLKRDLPRLEAFLALLPADRRAALEVRHDSWYDDDVLAALRARNVALCMADSEARPAQLIATADWGYLRLRAAYDDGALATWADALADQPWREAFVYFKHEDAGAGPTYVDRLVALAGARRSGEPR